MVSSSPSFSSSYYYPRGSRHNFPSLSLWDGQIYNSQSDRQTRRREKTSNDWQISPEAKKQIKPSFFLPLLDKKTTTATFSWKTNWMQCNYEINKDSSFKLQFFSLTTKSSNRVFRLRLFVWVCVCVSMEVWRQYCMHLLFSHFFYFRHIENSFSGDEGQRGTTQKVRCSAAL